MGGGDGLEQALVELQELAERLRRDCPWDRAQTAKTIVPHTVEEAYEVADAALAEDDAKLLDELGDLLFQTVFLALLLEERGSGDLAEVARGIRAKLIRRHPHVFGDAELETPAAVKGRWEELKREQEEREGIFHHVPEQLPPLLHARKVQKRAASAGFDELGDVLFAAVNVSRRLDVDPELALRAASRRFVERVERAAALAGEEGREWESLPLEEQDRYFDRAKEGIR